MIAQVRAGETKAVALTSPEGSPSLLARVAAARGQGAGGSATEEGRLRRVVIAVLSGVLGACSGGAGSPAGRPSPSATPQGIVDVNSPRPLPSPIPAIVARVNGEPVYAGGVYSLARSALAGAPDAGARRPRVYRQALNQLIVRELLFQESQRRKVVVRSEEIDAAYDAYRMKYRDETEWKKMLAEVGMDPDAFRADLRVQHHVDALVRSEGQKAAASVTESDVRSSYDSDPQENQTGERLMVAEVVVRVPAGAPADEKEKRRQRAQSAVVRARAGTTFAVLARELSDDSATVQSGGIRPELLRGSWFPVLEEAAFALKKGEVSDIVEAPDGLHVIKLLERLPSRALTFEERKPALQERAVRQKAEEALQALVASLRAKARIETFL
jgi:peptidyl-prolyl cis-trans isomerase C